MWGARIAVLCSALTLVCAASVVPVGAACPAGGRAGRDAGALSVVGGFDDGGGVPGATPHFADGAALAVADLGRRGVDVTWEPVAVAGAGALRDAFTASEAKRPDAVLALTSAADLEKVGPTIAATDVPFLALSSTPAGVRSGPSGGSNVFMMRPLAQQTYSAVVEFVCNDLRKRLDLGTARLALDVADDDLGRAVQDAVAREAPKHKRCEVLGLTAAGADPGDPGPRVQSVADSGANVVVSAGSPASTAAFVTALRASGATTPVVGGEELGAAVAVGAIPDLDRLWVAEHCVPELAGGKTAKRFVKAYGEAYGYPPNGISAQAYDALHLLADAVAEVGHDHARLNEALAAADYDGVCGYTADANNVLARSVTVYRYEGGTDATKVLAERLGLEPARIVEADAPSAAA